MGNLIKMDFRRMTRSTLFVVSLIVIAALNIIWGVVIPIVLKLVPDMPTEGATKLSELIANPFGLPLIIILMFMSVVSFSYADFAGGFVKNLAGQVGNRGSLVISKFIVIVIHNFIFLLVGVLTRILGALLGAAVGTPLQADGLVLAAVATFLIKWMLSMGICAILLFITTGVP